MPEKFLQAHAEYERERTSQLDAEESEAAHCHVEKAETPCSLVIFGATGDLASRKLFPALRDLAASGKLPDSFIFMGIGRTELSDEAFRERIRESLEETGYDDSTGAMATIVDRSFYCQADTSDAQAFKAIAKRLEDLEREHSVPKNRLFYLAVPPFIYEEIALGLGSAGLHSEEGGFSRIVIEKPFGHDLASARSLDASLHKHFREHQIFRIDHYLAKDTVQSILLLRFANAVFEPLWNRNYVDYIKITAAESLGVEHRAGYYDKAGVLRDMFQNHMMQLLALSAMEPPSIFKDDRVRDEKTKVYRALRPFPMDRFDDHLVLGQYSAGVIGNSKVAAYIDEPNVANDSLTPTFAAMKVYIDNWRWQGVPIYMTSGKRLRAKHTEIVVQFKEVPFSMFREALGEHISANRLVLSIQPKEEVSLTFQTKVPGPMCLRTVNMSFDYNRGFVGPKMDAYAKVLLDCMLGDHTLFWRQDAVELCWGFLTPIIMECDCEELKQQRLFLYKAGSDGPQQVKRLWGSM